MGLSGAGKSELARELYSLFKEAEISSARINGDEVREAYNDWDFSIAGRLRQAHRISDLANSCHAEYVIVDFIAPTKEIRDIFNSDVLIWLDTISISKYRNTDIIFQNPTNYQYKINKKDAKKFANIIFKDLCKGRI